MHVILCQHESSWIEWREIIISILVAYTISVAGHNSLVHQYPYRFWIRQSHLSREMSQCYLKIKLLKLELWLVLTKQGFIGAVGAEAGVPGGVGGRRRGVSVDRDVGDEAAQRGRGVPTRTYIHHVIWCTKIYMRPRVVSLKTSGTRYHWCHF